jgi:3-oxoacyl-[acyl-carrier-protein] synthase-3
MTRYAHITGWGMAVPEKVLTNDDISRFVETSDEWIQSRTGICQRRIASEKETTTTLAIQAAENALEVANLSPADLDLIIVATSTAEYIFPATACLVQDALGADKAGAFDMYVACTGFIYALNMAAQAIRSGSIHNALVIGSETLSRIVDWKDRNTCILFGDGAGAFVLQGSDIPGGVLSSVLRSDGSGADALYVTSHGHVRAAGISGLLDNTIKMDGKEVFRFATRVMADSTREAVAAAGLTVNDIRLIIPHQANRRIIDAAARSLNLPEEKFVINLDRYGNTSTASIPIALCEAVADGRLKANDRAVLVGFGGGLSWGAVAIHWDATTPIPITRWQRLTRQVGYSLAKVRSFARRSARRVEGALLGSGENGEKKKGDREAGRQVDR